MNEAPKGSLEGPTCVAVSTARDIRPGTALTPPWRIDEPEDIAQAAVLLAGIRSSYINGTEMPVNGGWVADLMPLIPRAGFEQEDMMPVDRD